MSYYFGALLRSAGVGAAPVRRPPDYIAIDDPFEQAVEAEATSPAEPAPAGGHAHGPGDTQTQPSALPQLAARAEAAPRAELPPESPTIEPRAKPGVPHAEAHAAVSGKAPPNRGAAMPRALHPVVQAALRWVAADPALRDGPARAEPQCGDEPPAQPVRSSLGEAARDRPGPRAAVTRPALPLAASPGHAAHVREPRAAEPAPAARHLETRPVRAEAPARAGASALRATTPSEPEVHIGSIHVTVDAPRPPPPAAPPARPAPPTRAAPARSAYLRSRAPRI